MNARNKGASGEREAAKWLQEKFDLETTPLRNLEQVRSGGYDLIGFEPFAMEIKRCEKLQLSNWWLQVVNSTPKNMVPIVMFRQNRKPWEFLLSAKLIGLDAGFLRIGEREFIQYIKRFSMSADTL